MGEDWEAISEEKLQLLVQDFLERFSCDARASEYLLRCPPDVQLKVVRTFAPRSQADSDYSRKLTSYVRSLLQPHSFEGGGGFGGGGSKKRAREESAPNKYEQEDPLGLLDEVPSDHELSMFRLQYPMDERAWDFLTSSSASVQSKVLRDFKPRSEGDPDYSSLVTTIVKRYRSTDAQEEIRLVSRSTDVRDSDGPPFPELRQFRLQYPMDERAWEYLNSIQAELQEYVVAEFKPRREGDTDYSAPITAFVRSLVTRFHSDGGGQRGPARTQLEAFRRRFPMDDRAFDFLHGSPSDIQLEVMRTFSPKQIEDSDYSRPITSYLRQVRENSKSQGMVVLNSGAGKGGGGDYGGTKRGGSRGQSPPPAKRSRRGDVQSEFDTGGCASEDVCRWLPSFRVCYPMDDRAFDFLLQSPIQVQELVITDFKPKRSGEADYSGAVTSFVRSVRQRTVSNGRSTGGTARLSHETPPSILEGFRRRYPMDERAWDYLCLSPTSVQQSVTERFKPRQEGEKDYSRLITSFIKATRGGSH